MNKISDFVFLLWCNLWKQLRWYSVFTTWERHKSK